MKKVVIMFKALADETRLTMMAMLLQHDELCVCDFVEVLDITQSKASRHLRYLCNAGLLDDRREGIWVYYRIAAGTSQEANALLGAFGSFIGTINVTDLERRLAHWFNRKKRSGMACKLKPPRKKLR